MFQSMNLEKLDKERKRRNLTIEELCSLAGMSKSAYYRKCKGTSQFTRKEMLKIAEILNLNSPVDIFFTNKVS